MLLIRRGFYLILGFTFPGFWTLHASGLFAILYKPIQWLFGTRATGWPSFITAATVYLLAALVFESAYRLLRKYQP